MEVPVLVLADAIDQGDVPAGDTGDGTLEAVIDTKLETADVEIVEVAIQGTIPIARFQVPVILFLKPLAKEVAHMTKCN